MDFLNNFLVVPVEYLPFMLLVLLVAFTVHEFSHAYFANLFGDPTAKLLGRVTLNPSRHLDVLGTLLFLIAGFGWARPVPVNRDNFKKPRLMGIIVSAAGPISNLVVAFIGVFIHILLYKFNVQASFSNERIGEAIDIFFNYLVHFNILLFIFNLIPLPPLDGYRIVEDLAPRSLRSKLQEFEKWSIFIFLLIVFLPPVRQVTIQPLFSLIRPIQTSFYNACAQILGLS
ncbi:site-2 protease family protein [Paenibacillus selenitireducens]|uniref:Site-2 protease family protein n=1 Tax=Paenibacillus selenitireducens TaxID=1324314 RepID=A0A1T2XF09_9BACL|nr:site-2 protease family protein [Paenibacillus selenitireducens]OPA78392.1 site-2 protease family protein [Paenibacillus selenitireducens]